MLSFYLNDYASLLEIDYTCCEETRLQTILGESARNPAIEVDMADALDTRK